MSGAELPSLLGSSASLLPAVVSNSHHLDSASSPPSLHSDIIAYRVQKLDITAQ